MDEQAKINAWKWGYDNAVSILILIVLGIGSWAFSRWSESVDEAKDAYIQGQREVLSSQTLILTTQREQGVQLALINARQERALQWLQDLESRVRILENNH